MDYLALASCFEHNMFRCRPALRSLSPYEVLDQDHSNQNSDYLSLDHSSLHGSTPGSAGFGVLENSSCGADPGITNTVQNLLPFQDCLCAEHLSTSSLSGGTAALSTPFVASKYSMPHMAPPWHRGLTLQGARG